MDKHAWDRAIGEVPRSTVDVDAIIARGRRAAWVHRSANPWVATAAGVVAMAVGVVALLPGGGDAGGVVTPASPPDSSVTSPTSSSAPTEPPPRDRCAELTSAPPVPETPEVAKTRLAGVLTAAVSQQLAQGSQLVANPAAQYPQGTQHGPLEFYKLGGGGSAEACGEGYFMAMATVVRQQQKGSITVQVSRAAGGEPPTECVDYGAVTEMSAECEERTGPGGETIVVSTITYTDTGATTYDIAVTKPDGTGVVLFAGNTASMGKLGDAPESSAPPLTHDQLIAIALDPAMTLYPR